MYWSYSFQPTSLNTIGWHPSPFQVALHSLSWKLRHKASPPCISFLVEVCTHSPTSYGKDGELSWHRCDIQYAAMPLFYGMAATLNKHVLCPRREFNPGRHDSKSDIKMTSALPTGLSWHLKLLQLLWNIFLKFKITEKFTNAMLKVYRWQMSSRYTFGIWITPDMEANLWGASPTTAKQ